jgi:hypothetical protein
VGISKPATMPTSPSHRFATGPSLSPLKGGEGAFGLPPYSSALTISSHIFLASPNSIIVLLR